MLNEVRARIIMWVVSVLRESAFIGTKSAVSGGYFCTKKPVGCELVEQITGDYFLYHNVKFKARYFST